MADAADETYEEVGSGASETVPKQCSSLRKNDHVILKGRPCKIVEMSTSKTGKHGHAKVHLVGVDIFTEKKYEDICPSTHNMDCPRVTRKDYQLIDIEDNEFLTLMDEKKTDSALKQDLRLPTESIGKEILEKFEKGEDLIMVTVLGAMGEERVVGVKLAK